MLRLHDVRRDGLAEVEPARRGQLRVVFGGPAGPPDLADLRPALIADLIRRSAQRHRLSVLTTQASPGSADPGPASAPDTAAADAAGFQDDCSALNIRPPDYAPEPGEPAGPVDVLILRPASGRPDAPAASGASDRRDAARYELATGAVLFDDAPLPGTAGQRLPLAELARRGLDPLALRLTALGVSYGDPLRLSWPVLAQADGELRRWRDQVADWATHPSYPMPAGAVAEVAAAFDADLDTAAALAALRVLARRADVPPGAKFETCAHLDQLLGLDLARDIGRSPDPLPLPGGAQRLLDERATARDRADAPAVRQFSVELASLGVAVSDAPGGQHWTVERGV